MAEEKNVQNVQTKKQSKVSKFFKDYKSEFKKIAWPSKEDTGKMSAVVIAAIIVASIGVLLIDTGARSVFDWLSALI